MKKPTTILREKLLADQRIVDLVGQKIFPVNADDVDLPFIIIRSRSKSENDKSGLAINDHTADVDFHSAKDSYDIGEQAYWLILEILGNTSVNLDDCSVIIKTSGSEEFFSMYYHTQVQRLEFTVKY